MLSPPRPPQCLKQESSDIKQLAALVITYMARGVDCALPSSVLKALIPMLVNGTKEKNTLVRTNCEQALIALLRLRHKEDAYQVSLFKVRMMSWKCIIGPIL